MDVSNLNLRSAIKQNMQGSSVEDVRDTIVDAITSGEEKMLPGLGVFFEMLWREADEQDKNKMVDAIHHQIQ